MNRETYWKLQLALQRLREAEDRLQEAIAKLVQEKRGDEE